MLLDEAGEVARTHLWAQDLGLIPNAMESHWRVLRRS